LLQLSETLYNKEKESEVAMFNDLSERQQSVLRYICDYILEKHYSPSFREIKAVCGIASTSTVSKTIHALAEAGYLTMDKGNYRSIQLIESRLGEYLPQADEHPMLPVDPVRARDDVYDIPMYGRVAAGAPIYADNHIETTVPLPSAFFPNDSCEYFILTISGESMIEAGIFDGDHVLVRKQETARNGEQVVALIDDEATVKTFFRRADHIELRPENASMSPIIVRECRILGVVCGLYRLY